MNKKKLTNEELDRIGRELIRASATRLEAIEEAASSPMLFSSIKRRIETEKADREKVPAWNWESIFPFGWNRAASVLAAVAIFLAGTVTVFVLAKRNPPQQTVRIDNPAPAIIKKSEPASIDVPAAPPEKTQVAAVVNYKKEPARAERAATHRPVKRVEAPAFEAEGDFYPVAGAPQGTLQEGHVVRAEIPRSSLFAMGMDIAADGASEKVKTDLLVGSDGVVRGIRIVK